MTSDLLLKQGMEIQGYKDVLWGKKPKPNTNTQNTPPSARKQTNHLELFTSVVFKSNIMYTQKFTKELRKHLAFHCYLVLHALKY